MKRATKRWSPIVLPSGWVTSPQYIYVRGRQLEGTYPGLPSTGVWISSGLRVAKGWGNIEEADWPYDGTAEQWPPNEPPGIDQKAKKFRISAYERARSVEDCLYFLVSKLEVTAAFQIDNSWYKAQNGVIPLPGGKSVTASHTVLLCGYDKNAKRFKFLNSWGDRWGDSGYGYLPFEYFSSRFLEGWVILSTFKKRPTIPSGLVLRTWAIKDPLGGVFHGIEIWDITNDEILGWAFAVERDSFLDVEEIFVRPKWRRRGHASQLISELKLLVNRLNHKPRAWIPHSDYGTDNIPAVRAVLKQLSLGVIRSSVRWAAAVGR
jgi:GNAT superfamily N-acetyltransferase